MRQLENWIAFVGVSVFVSLATATMAGPPSGAAFTFQGQLEQSGSPVTDNCDIELGLFDVDTGGIAIATESFLKVAVVNGLFTVRPDFGANGFDGSARYLEVRVDCGGSGTVTLAPRHEITPTPESLFSKSTDGLVVDGTGQVGIGTGTPGARLTISRPTQAADYQLEIRNEGSIQQPSFDGIAFTQEPDGSTELASIKVIYRNNGRPDLSFSVRDKADALFINGNHDGRGGNVGMGTTAPEAKLHVNGDVRVNGGIQLDGDVVIPPTTRYLTIGAADMVPQSSSMSVYRSFAEIVSFLRRPVRSRRSMPPSTCRTEPQ